MPIPFMGFKYNDPAATDNKYRISRNGQTWTDPVSDVGTEIAGPGWEGVTSVRYQVGNSAAPFNPHVQGVIGCCGDMQRADVELTPVGAGSDDFENFTYSDPNANGHYYQVAKNNDAFDPAQLPVGTSFITSGWSNVAKVRYQIKDAASHLVVAQGQVEGNAPLKAVNINVTP